jgi:hypothetical protein
MSLLVMLCSVVVISRERSMDAPGDEVQCPDNVGKKLRDKGV